MATATFDAPDATKQQKHKESTFGSKAVTSLTTTDHTVIGQMYAVTAFFFFVFGGILALIIRAELARPGTQLVGDESSGSRLPAIL